MIIQFSLKYLNNSPSREPNTVRMSYDESFGGVDVSLTVEDDVVVVVVVAAEDVGDDDALLIGFF